MNVAQALREATALLSAVSDTARLDAELLMAHALGVSRSAMLLRWTTEPSPPDFQPLLRRRQRHEPIAYITGFQEFFGRSFKVTRDTLIPRPDSETIVEAALEVFGGSQDAQRRVLDLGTGTGALLLSVLAERPDSLGFGLDINAAALAVAQENASLQSLGTRAAFGLGSWHDVQKPWAIGWPETYDLVLANPPYVETSAALDPQVRDYEPHCALFAGPEGLDDYQAIIPGLKIYLSPGGVAVLEIGATQAGSVAELAEKAGFAVEVRHDLANRPRALILS